MFRNLLAFVGRLSFRRVLFLGLFCAVAIEALTAALRFGLDLQVTRDTRPVGTFTFGLRIHHSYLGLLLVPAALWVRHRSLRNLLLIVAIGLFLSDMFHHFFVLWLLTGSPRFDLFYPPAPAISVFICVDLCFLPASRSRVFRNVPSTRRTAVPPASAGLARDWWSIC